MSIVQEKVISYSNKTTIFDYFSIFTLIFLSSSFFGLSMNGSLNLTLLLIVSISTLVFNYKRLSLNIKTLTLFVVIIVFTGFTMVVNLDSPTQYLIFWASLLSGFMIFLSFDLNRFINVYIKVVYFLCVYSLFSFLIVLLTPNFLTLFPTITNVSGLTVSNLFFSVAHDSNYFNANYGIFWEPGAYQTFINFALYFQLFIIKELNFKIILVFLVTIFTTFSTTGYLAALFLIIIFLLNKDKSRYKNFGKKKFIGKIAILFVIALAVFLMLPNHITFKVFGKLEALFNPNLIWQNAAYISTISRVDALKIPISNFISNPIFGKGFENLYNSSINGNINFLTATPLNWFGLFGISLGILFNYSIWRFTKLSFNSVIIRIFEFVFLNLILLSQYFNANSFLLVVIFFGFRNNPINIKNR